MRTNSHQHPPAARATARVSVAGWFGLLLLALGAAAGAADKPAPAKPATAMPAPASAAECDKAAKAWFAKAYANGKQALKSGRTVQASYRAHYNAGRKQCLARVENDTPAQGKSPAVANISIHDVGADNQKILASLIRVREKTPHCVVEDKKCQSAEEWDKLAAPMMQQ